MLGKLSCREAAPAIYPRASRITRKFISSPSRAWMENKGLAWERVYHVFSTILPNSAAFIFVPANSPFIRHKWEALVFIPRRNTLFSALFNPTNTRLTSARLGARFTIFQPVFSLCAWIDFNNMSSKRELQRLYVCVLRSLLFASLIFDSIARESVILSARAFQFRALLNLVTLPLVLYESRRKKKSFSAASERTSRTERASNKGARGEYSPDDHDKIIARTFPYV